MLIFYYGKKEKLNHANHSNGQSIGIGAHSLRADTIGMRLICFLTNELSRVLVESSHSQDSHILIRTLWHSLVLSDSYEPYSAVFHWTQSAQYKQTSSTGVHLSWFWNGSAISIFHSPFVTYSRLKGRLRYAAQLKEHYAPSPS